MTVPGAHLVSVRAVEGSLGHTHSAPDALNVQETAALLISKNHLA